MKVIPTQSLRVSPNEGELRSSHRTNSQTFDLRHSDLGTTETFCLLEEVYKGISPLSLSHGQLG